MITVLVLFLIALSAMRNLLLEMEALEMARQDGMSSHEILRAKLLENIKYNIKSYS